MTSDSNKNNIVLEFAGWGKTQYIEDLNPAETIRHLDQPKKNFLGEWSSTALCGNDITSSCLYVSALALTMSGMLAPLVLIFVGITLYFFRKIYGEVGSALPLNGGTYTLLLNTTSKKLAAAAAGLTLLSYIATAVISANEAIHYLRVLIPVISPTWGVVLLLGIFAILTIIGIGESSIVAIGIFFTHIVTLAILIIAGFFFVFKSPETLFQNFSFNYSVGEVVKSLVLGFSVALLGISGFESSANFIEEQKTGVFPKTLKNMWLAVFIINPLIAFVSLGLVPLKDVSSLGEGFLSHLGLLSMGQGFSSWVSINAFLVLSGAVLTSFIGIIGLVRRMALDRCMPDFLLIENKLRGTNHWIILGFYLVCLSIFFITGGSTIDLAGVYTLSFLSVMGFFAIGNALLKAKRSRLPRSEIAPWSSIGFGFILVSIGVCGNLILNPTGGLIFLAYYAVTLILIMALLLRSRILRFLLLVFHYSVSSMPQSKDRILDFLSNWIKKINTVPVLYFSKGDNLASLNQAVTYVLQNEQSNHLTVCHIYQEKDQSIQTLSGYIRVIDEIYPKLKIDLVLIQGVFTPSFVESVSEYLKIAKNRMFIGSPGGTFPHRIEDLGGVRVILSGDGV